jgi:hypothetical protein
MAPGRVILMLLIKTVVFVHENLKIALPESRVSGEIARHMSVFAH